MGATIAINEDTNWFCRKGLFDVLADRLSDANVTWLPKLFDEARESNIYLVDLSDEEAYLKRLLAEVVISLVNDLQNNPDFQEITPDWRESSIQIYMELHAMLQADIQRMLSL